MQPQSATFVLGLIATSRKLTVSQDHLSVVSSNLRVCYDKMAVLKRPLPFTVYFHSPSRGGQKIRAISWTSGHMSSQRPAGLGATPLASNMPGSWWPCQGQKNHGTLPVGPPANRTMQLGLLPCGAEHIAQQMVAFWVARGANGA